MTNERGTEYDILGVGQSASDEDKKRAFLKQVLKWHPGKNICYNDSAKKIRQVTEAYKSVASPTVKRLENGRIVTMKMDAKYTSVNDKYGGVWTDAIKRGISRWFGMDMFNTHLDDRIGDGLELLSQYMYDGDLNDYFFDDDSKETYVTGHVSLSRALIGGKIKYYAPCSDGMCSEYIDEIDGILDGTWKPIKYINHDGMKFWVIYKIVFPREVTEEEEAEIRRKLLVMQISSAFFTRFINWFRFHPFSATAMFSIAFAGLVVLCKSGLSSLRNRLGWEID